GFRIVCLLALAESPCSAPVPVSLHDALPICTFNGAISVDKNKEAVKTVLEDYKEAGRSTGLVATSQLTHETPAAFAAHNESRERSEEHTSELQSRFDLVCRLLLERKTREKRT